MSTHDEQASLEDTIDEAYDDSVEDGIDVEETAEPEIEASEDIDVEASAEEPEVIEEPPLEPHPMWKSQYRKLFEEMGGIQGGRNYQQGMLDLYGETHRYANEKAQEAARFQKMVEPWQQTFQPISQQLAMMGTDPVTFTRQLIGYYGQLQQNPAQAIMQLAKQFNVDLNEVTRDAPYVDPQVSALDQRFARLEEAHRREQMQARQRESDRIMQSIQTFASETDASGNPVHPHFDEVQETMTRVLNSGMASDLESAYKTACKLQDISVAQAASSDAEKLRQDAARKAAKAKKEVQAAKRTVGKPSGKDGKPAHLRDDIGAAYDSHAA